MFVHAVQFEERKFSRFWRKWGIGFSLISREDHDAAGSLRAVSWPFLHSPEHLKVRTIKPIQRWKLPVPDFISQLLLDIIRIGIKISMSSCPKDSTEANAFRQMLQMDCIFPEWLRWILRLRWGLLIKWIYWSIRYYWKQYCKINILSWLHSSLP